MSDEQFREDELVSAYLDGEATPAEIARVEQDDALMARIEQLRSVRDAVASPVAPVPAELRDQMIEAALAVADAESAQRREARIVPIHRRRETLLAVAAAAILLAAVVSAGLISTRGGDDDAEMAADAPAMEAAPAADMAATAEEEAVAATTTAAYAEIAEEEPMAEEEPLAELDAAMAEMAADEPDEAAMAELEAAAAEAESAMEASAEEAEVAPTASADETDQKDEGRGTADGAAVEVVDLGVFENLESLFDDIAARWSAALEEGAMANSGTCSAAVHDKALELDIQAGQPFVVTVTADDSQTFDGQFARRADGTAIIVYAGPPICEPGIYELGEPDGS